MTSYPFQVFAMSVGEPNPHGPFLVRHRDTHDGTVESATDACLDAAQNIADTIGYPVVAMVQDYAGEVVFGKVLTDTGE
jgi:hypothetical protein